MNELPTDAGLLGAIAAGVTGAAMLIRQLAASYRSDKIDSVGTDAHIQVVELLREEVARLTESNRKLADRIDELTTRNRELSAVVRELQTELGECLRKGKND